MFITEGSMSPKEIREHTRQGLQAIAQMKREGR
jgi:hypothetical protein